jgi:hypothetical protein
LRERRRHPQLCSPHSVTAVTPAAARVAACTHRVLRCMVAGSVTERRKSFCCHLAQGMRQHKQDVGVCNKRRLSQSRNERQIPCERYSCNLVIWRCALLSCRPYPAARHACDCRTFSIHPHRDRFSSSASLTQRSHALPPHVIGTPACSPPPTRHLHVHAPRVSCYDEQVVVSLKSYLGDKASMKSNFRYY